MPSLLLSENWKHHFVYANGINFHIVLNQSVNRLNLTKKIPLVIFLPGFLEYWWSWHLQLIALDINNIPAISVDLRGTGASDKPPRDYDLDSIAADINAIAVALGYQKIILVGRNVTNHIIEATIKNYPLLVAGIIISAGLITTKLKPNFPKLKYFLNIPTKNNHFMQKFLSNNSTLNWKNSNFFLKVNSNFTTALSNPLTISANIKLVKSIIKTQSIFKSIKFNNSTSPINLPILILNGAEDKLIWSSKNQNEPLIDYHKSEIITNAAHFLHLENPNSVNTKIIKFYSQNFINETHKLQN